MVVFRWVVVVKAAPLVVPLRHEYSSINPRFVLPFGIVHSDTIYVSQMHH